MSSSRFWKDPILLVILATTLGLAIVEGALAAVFGNGQVLGSSPAFVPMMHAFMVLGAVCIFQEDWNGPLLAGDIRLVLFRIYQESLANITKHAQATQVAVRVKRTREQVALEIQDNGIGFNVPQDWLELARHGHLGLVGMRERAEAIGGTLGIISSPGKGTTLQVTVSLQDPLEIAPAA